MLRSLYFRPTSSAVYEVRNFNEPIKPKPNSPFLIQKTCGQLLSYEVGAKFDHSLSNPPIVKPINEPHSPSIFFTRLLQQIPLNFLYPKSYGPLEYKEKVLKFDQPNLPKHPTQSFNTYFLTFKPIVPPLSKPTLFTQIFKPIYSPLFSLYLNPLKGYKPGPKVAYSVINAKNVNQILLPLSPASNSLLHPTRLLISSKPSHQTSFQVPVIQTLPFTIQPLSTLLILIFFPYLSC